ESTSVEVYLDSSHQLAIFIPYKGYFTLHPINPYLFLLEDAQEYISFLPDENGLPKSIIYHRNSRAGKKQ
ncbi:MAG: hypothetical protein AAFU03_15830, partial [Bacteroidota bacterium]